MTRLFYAAVVLLIGGLAAMGQAPQKAVVWSGSPACGARSKSVAAEDQLSCSTVSTERGPVSSITYNGITLAVAFLDDRDLSLVAAQIANASPEVISFDSDLWGAAHFRTREDFYRRAQPILAETSIPSRDLLRSMARGNRLENSLGEFMGDMAMTAETREIKRPDGTKYKVTVIVPDQDAKASEERQSVSRTENLTAEQLRLRETALTAKSVAAGSSIKGVVYFRRVKKAEFVVFSLSVGDVTFLFHLPRPKKH